MEQLIPIEKSGRFTQIEILHMHAVSESIQKSRISECPESRNRFERRISIKCTLPRCFDPIQEPPRGCRRQLFHSTGMGQRCVQRVPESVACHVPNIIREDHPIARYFPYDLSFSTPISQPVSFPPRPRSLSRHVNLDLQRSLPSFEPFSERTPILPCPAAQRCT